VLDSAIKGGALTSVREISGGGVPMAIECSGRASTQTRCLDTA